MKTKLEMAHEYAMAHIQEGWDINYDVLVVDAWQYADAMQAEADKREKEEAAQRRKEIREMLNAPNTFVEREGQHFDDVADACKTYGSSDEWQPDWSQAPDVATHWTMRQDGKCLWWKGKPLFDGSCFYDAVGICHTVGYAPSFGYTGDWRNSLRKRPK